VKGKGGQRVVISSTSTLVESVYVVEGRDEDRRLASKHKVA